VALGATGQFSSLWGVVVGQVDALEFPAGKADSHDVEVIEFDLLPEYYCLCLKAYL